MKRILITTLISCLIAIVSCRNGQQAQYCTIYADTSLWYSGNKPVDNNLVDVFYIAPTCVFDWSDSLGITQHWASPQIGKHRRRMEACMDMGKAIFADSANFFAPYYRQITMDSWFMCEDTINKRFKTALFDVRNAFNYYLMNINNGRPFILAGYSQGGKCVVELLKMMPESLTRRMVAAYVCGYKVTDDDMKSTRCIKPAQGEFDTGVTIVYNTVCDLGAICPIVSEGNTLVINPATWSTDEKWHQLNDSVSLRICNDKKVIMARGLNAKYYHIKSLENLFKLGNLHLQELNLYHDVLSENVKARTRAFMQDYQCK